MNKFAQTLINMLAIVCVLSSCSDAHNQLNEIENTGECLSLNTTTSPKIELSEALTWADGIFDEMGVENTRSGRIIENVEVYNINKTRACESNLPDTLLYLINYSNNGGFALLGADRRIPYVYAISDRGHLEFADTLNNKGLALFMANVNDEILCNEAFRPTDDNTQPVVYVKPNYSSLSSTYRIIKPCIAVDMRDMGQWEPYNSVVVSNIGTNVPVGCVPLALAMILGHYEYPLQWDGITLNWDEIKNNSKCDAMQKLLYSLGKKENLNVKYTSTGSSAYSSDCLTVLKKMGYKTPDSLIPFNVDSALFTLNEKYKVKKTAPIYISGSQCDENGDYIQGSGHAWVIDGVLQRQITTTTPAFIINDINNYHLFHCVWGWYGVNNGYFRFTTSNGFEIEPSKYDTDDSQQKSVAQHHFKYFLQMFGVVQPPQDN